MALLLDDDEALEKLRDEALRRGHRNVGELREPSVGLLHRTAVDEQPTQPL